MSAQLLDGRTLSHTIQDQLAHDIQSLNATTPPGLAVILVGHNPASATYVAHKKKACERVGINTSTYEFPENCTVEDLQACIATLNQDPKVHGILLQLPLPDHISSQELLTHIHPGKDVDGFHPYNLGCLLARQPTLRPCTPYGIMTLLNTLDLDLTGQHAVVVGASNIVGRPMALELLLAKCTVTVTHRYTQTLSEHVASADILISAVGKTGIIKSEWIRSGTIVIDVGINHDPNTGRLRGDIEFESAAEKASWITPVPGGVGPMTVAMLLHNTLQAYRQQSQST